MNLWAIPATNGSSNKSTNLDAFMRKDVSTATKVSDKELEKIQSFVLDALAR